MIFTDDSSKIVFTLYVPYLAESCEEQLKTIHIIWHEALYVCYTICSVFFQAVDTMYFTSVAKDGSYCVLRIARRHERKAEVWLSIKVVLIQ